MKKCENLLGERSKLKDATTGKKIVERKKIEQKIESLFEEIRLDIKEMEKELKHQKNNRTKFSDIDTKNEILDLLKKKADILKSKYEDSEYNEDEYSQNEEKIQTLEQFLNTNNSSGNNEGRALYEEEEKKMEEWNYRMKNQDEQLDDIHKGVRQLKYEAGLAGQGIKNIDSKVQNVTKHVDKTQKSVNTQNSRLKELIFKFRSADKYCCDIILILILIGLVCTLYSIIKHKF